MFMPMARLAQYQHCLFRRNAVRTMWCEPTNSADGRESAEDEFTRMRQSWRAAVDSAEQDE